jgi:hypothetical protein
MPGANGKGNFDAITQERSLDFALQHEVAAVAFHEQLGDRAAVTELSLPWSSIIGVGRNEPAFFFVLTAKVVPVEVSTIDRFVHSGRR